MTITLEERNAALDRAKALILQGWTQGALARNEAGESIYEDVSRRKEKGVCFCASGAVFVAEGEAFGPAWRALRAVTIELCDAYPSNYNDVPGRTKYEVAALFDHAKEQPL